MAQQVGRPKRRWVKSGWRPVVERDPWSPVELGLDAGEVAVPSHPSEVRKSDGVAIVTARRPGWPSLRVTPLGHRPGLVWWFEIGPRSALEAGAPDEERLEAHLASLGFGRAE